MKTLTQKSNIKHKKHGLKGTRIYRIWISMKSRCNNKNATGYKNYGGRGISICEEWINNAESFNKWALKSGYEDNLSLDRIDNDGNYEPLNCRWATKEVQARNTKKIKSTNTTGYRGVSFKNNKFRACIYVNSKHIHLGYFDFAINAAFAYDYYIYLNKLEHTKNF